MEDISDVLSLESVGVDAKIDEYAVNGKSILIFRDDYFIKLNECCKVEDVLGSKFEGVVKNVWSDVNFFVNGVCDMVEGNKALYDLLRKCAILNCWQPMLIKPSELKEFPAVNTPDSYVRNVVNPCSENIFNTYYHCGGDILAYNSAYRRGMICPATYEDFALMIPTPEFISMLSEKSD